MNKLSSSTISPLGKRIFVILFLISICVSFAVSAALLWLDYQAGIKRYEEVLNQISSSYQSSISYSLWNFDSRQLESQLQGITNFPGIVYVQVDNDGKVISSKGDLYEKAERRFVIPLFYKNNQTSHLLGQLRINQSYEALYESLYSRGAAILLSNIILFFLVVFIVLIVLHRLVTRRLWQMARWAQRFSLANLDDELIIDQQPHAEDEFSYVVDAINQMRITIQDELTLREKENLQREQLKEQFALAVDNAALGFCRYEINNKKFICNTHFASQLGTNEVDIEDMRDPMSFFINQITGPNSIKQTEGINQLLKGNKVRFHDRFTMQQGNQQAVLEASFQVISYRDNCPEQVLICMTDLTKESKLQNKIAQLNIDKEQDKATVTNILQSENQRLLEEKKEFRQEILKLRLSQQPKHLKALSGLMDEYLNSWKKAMAPGEYDLWRAFLDIDFYKKLITIDVSQLIGNLTTVIANKHSVLIKKDLPFSIIADEDPDVLSFAIEKILFPELLEQSSEMSLNVRLNNSRLNTTWVFTTEADLELLEKSLSYKLAHIIIRIRYNGSITSKKEGEKLEIFLSTPFRT